MNPYATGHKGSGGRQAGIDQQILSLNPREAHVHPEIAQRVMQMLKPQESEFFREVKKSGPAAISFYVWVRNSNPQ